MFSSSGQGQTSYVPSEGISCKELAASGNKHLLKPGGENRHGDGVDDKEEEELDAIIKNQVISRPLPASPPEKTLRQGLAGHVAHFLLFLRRVFHEHRSVLKSMVAWYIVINWSKDDVDANYV